MCFGALLTDLSEAFDCPPHDLLLGKLLAYGLDIKSVKFLFSYLNNRKHRTKIINEYSSWENLSYGVPYGSISGPFLFNVYMIDLFFSINFDVASYADDTTQYVSEKIIDDVLQGFNFFFV